MTPQQRDEFVRQNLYKQMQAAKNGSAKFLSRLNNELSNNDKNFWTLLKTQTISIQHKEHTFYGLYVKQNAKTNYLPKLKTI